MSQTDIRDNNKQLAIEAALSHFREKGVEATTLAEVAAASGLASRSLYRYFGDREGLVSAVAARYWSYMLETVDEIYRFVTEEEVTGYEMLKKMTGSFYEIYIQRRGSMVMLLEIEAFIIRHNVKYSDITSLMTADRSNSPFAYALRRGQEDGTIRSDLDVSCTCLLIRNLVLPLMQRLACSESGGGPSGRELAKSHIEACCAMLLDYVRVR